MSSLTTLERHAAAHRNALVGESLRRWGASLRSTLLWPIRFYRARREFTALASLSDYQLKDIGLTRTDLSDATALPRDEDPTLILEHRVRERRQNSRARRARS